MSGGPTRISRPASAGRLVVLLAAGAFLLAGLTGNSLSAHVGMTMSAHVSALEVETGPLPVVVEAASGAVATSPDRGTGGHAPLDHDAQHLLHLLGGCVAVLAALVLVAQAVSWRGVLPRRPEATAARPVALPALAWWPPPPSPPTASPVLRT